MPLPFLDIFLKRLPKGNGGSGARMIALGEAVAMMSREVESQVAPIYSPCERICKAILTEAEAAKKAAAGVGQGRLDKAQPQYRIGLQMQKNFAERAPAALEALTPPAKNYQSLARFHSTAVETVKTVAKISNDNRYLPYFLSDEIGAFGKRMNEIIRLADELGVYLDMKRDAVGQLETARRLEGEIRALNERLEADGKLKIEIADKRKAHEAEIASALEINRRLEKESGELKQKVESIRMQVSAERKRLTDQLSPFQRQFRKMHKRIIEKEETKALDTYIEGAEDAAIREVGRSGDHPMLRKILTGMKTALEKGDLEDDAKIRSRRLAAISDILGGSLIAPAKRAMELGRELAAEEDALSDVSRRMSGTDEARKRMEHESEQIAKIEGDERKDRERMENAFLELESLVKESTDETVKIGRASM